MAPDTDATAGTPKGWHDLKAVLAEEPVATLLAAYLDGRAHRCIVPSGHRGAKGELWYVRLLPPLDERFDHGVCFTSPYVLRGLTYPLIFIQPDQGDKPSRPGR